MKFEFAALAMLLGCDPLAEKLETNADLVHVLPPDRQMFDVTLINGYADSIFNVNMYVVAPSVGSVADADGGAALPVDTALRIFDLQRISEFDSADAGPFEIIFGADINLNINVESLGQWSNFDPIIVSPKRTPHFAATYVFDVADAKFHLHYTP